MPDYNESIRNELESLMDAERNVSEPAPWAFLAVAATRKTRRRRFCVHCRSLNRFMEADGWRLLITEDLCDRFESSTLLTTFDLSGGYWQIRGAKSCKEMTTFIIRSGIY